MSELRYSIRHSPWSHDLQADNYEVFGPGMTHPTFGRATMTNANLKEPIQERNLLALLQRAYEAGKRERSAELRALLGVSD